MLVAGGLGLLLGGVARPGAAALLAGMVLGAAGALDWRRQSRAASEAVQSDAASMDEWLAARDAQTARRARLEALLEGGSLHDLLSRADQAAHRSAELAAVAGVSTVEEDIDGLRRELRESERLAAAAEQAVAELHAQQQPWVPEAEEALEQARAEAARLEQLDDVLTRTRQYLERAQARVYRDIAPRLAAALGRDLATVTQGRYTEAFVDPRSLAVRVRAPNGAPRDAADLSVGTVEQVYLLLRVALAEHLVREGESCPLLLDDVTVHADESRTQRILDVLSTIADRHQVVLFTKQPQVLRWAQATVDGHRHVLRELTALAPA